MCICTGMCEGLDITAPKEGVHQKPKFLRKPLQGQSNTGTPHVLPSPCKEGVRAMASYPSPHQQPH